MVEKFNVLIVDDEAPMRKLLELYLKEQNYHIDTAMNGHEAIDKVKTTEYHLVLLDVMMPGMSGWEVCVAIRKFSEVPILMLTARDETEEKVKGLRLGADDYLTKPFEEIELLARIEAILRRMNKAKKNENMIEHKGIMMDITSRSVSYYGQLIELTPREFDLLFTFLNHIGRVFDREQLLELIWSTDYSGDTRTVDTHVKNLREKLKKHGVDAYSILKTVWGVGYKAI
ncbi:MAG TPA: response regulator transcription factor [Bacillota bacterium]|nr:response regulator transcription factor [Bacillota bacterium]